MFLFMLKINLFINGLDVCIIKNVLSQMFVFIIIQYVDKIRDNDLDQHTFKLICNRRYVAQFHVCVSVRRTNRKSRTFITGIKSNNFQ